jgi:flagellar hook protein FlgE
MAFSAAGPDLARKAWQRGGLSPSQLAMERSMVGSPWFQPSASGLYGQGAALAAISANIANATTDGYKRAEVSFATLMSRTVASAPGAAGEAAPRNAQSDLGGVVAIERHRIAEAGSIIPTGNALDAAIAGKGFFVLAADPAKPTDLVYGRAGHFGLLPAAPGQSGGTLVDQNGYAVLGWPVDATGTAATTAAPAPITVDFGRLADPGRTTTTVRVSGDVPATAAIGSEVALGLQVYDGSSRTQPLSLILSRQTATEWSVAIDAGAGATVSITPTAAPGQPPVLAFDGLGQPLPPAVLTVTLTPPSGPASTFQVDLAGVRQSGNGSSLSFAQDGYGPGALQSIAFDRLGRVVGTFDNGRASPLFQLAIADFINPDGLAPLSGTVYAATELSGSPALGAAGDGARGSVVGGAIEQSNVDLAEEFSRMILVQHAYNSAAQAFRTVDEMSQVARDLKRV